MLPSNIAQFPMHLPSLQNTQQCYINTMLVNNVKQMKQIVMGYYYNCEHCGIENAYGVTQQELDDEIREWEEDNADLVAEGETGESACDWWYEVTAEENNAHIEQAHKCWSCDKTQTKWAKST